MRHPTQEKVLFTENSTDLAKYLGFRGIFSYFVSSHVFCLLSFQIGEQPDKHNQACTIGPETCKAPIKPHEAVWFFRQAVSLGFS